MKVRLIALLFGIGFSLRAIPAEAGAPRLPSANITAGEWDRFRHNFPNGMRLPREWQQALGGLPTPEWGGVMRGAQGGVDAMNSQMRDWIGGLNGRVNSRLPSDWARLFEQHPSEEWGQLVRNPPAGMSELPEDLKITFGNAPAGMGSLPRGWGETLANMDPRHWGSFVRQAGNGLSRLPDGFIDSLSDFNFAEEDWGDFFSGGRSLFPRSSSIEDGPASTVEDSLFGDTNESNLITAWNGWPDSYNGYGRSSILMDPREPNMSRVETLSRKRLGIKAGSGLGARIYPELAKNKMMSPAGQERSITKLNLGVDRPLTKANMVRYRPIYALELDYAGSTLQRDTYLSMYESVIGVANLTLAYLDKTVAASLATTKQQAQTDATNQLLKQVNWLQAKMADPVEGLLQRDVDEKVEYCLAANTNLPNVSGSRFNFQDDECRAKCGDPMKLEDPSTGVAGGAGGFPGGGGGGGTGGVPGFGGGGGGFLPFSRTMAKKDFPGVSGATGLDLTGGGATRKPGTYSWCVCCAEVSEGMNRSTNQIADDGMHNTAGYDLWDRVLYGSARPTAGANLDHVRLVGQAFKTTYGNMIIGPKRREDGSYAQPGDPEYNLTVLQYDPPALSLPVRIRIFRDGMDAVSADYHMQCSDYVESDYSGESESLACPYTGMKIKHGIYNAIVEILRLLPPEEANSEELQELWTEASLGVLLTPSDFKDMLKLPGGGEMRLPSDWEPQGKLLRWLNAFSDASAIAAFKRFHLKMMAIAADHFAYNVYATEEEKDRARGLMQRVTDQLNRAELDAHANYLAMASLSGLWQEADRMDESSLASTTTSNLSHLIGRAQSANLTSFGNVSKNVTSLCRGSECGTVEDPFAGR